MSGGFVCITFVIICSSLSYYLSVDYAHTLYLEMVELH